MKITRVGVDLAKNVFQLHGIDRSGKCVWKRKLSRNKWLRTLLKKTDSCCEIGMEACTGAHHWSRVLMNKGYRVKIIAPQFVNPYVKAENKHHIESGEAALQFPQHIDEVADVLQGLDNWCAQHPAIRFKFQKGNAVYLDSFIVTNLSIHNGEIIHILSTYRTNQPLGQGKTTAIV